MAGGAFNSDQEEYMASLSRVPASQKCWCGWYQLGECPDCPPDATCEQKMAAACSHCRNAPSRPGGELIHIVNCPEQKP